MKGAAVEPPPRALSYLLCKVYAAPEVRFRPIREKEEDEKS
ncbi:MAG TPA: hypothetical protein VGE45_15660 [Chloroflexia bacterium]|jgi:hypothetical protein